MARVTVTVTPGWEAARARKGQKSLRFATVMHGHNAPTLAYTTWQNQRVEGGLYVR